MLRNTALTILAYACYPISLKEVVIKLLLRHVRYKVVVHRRLVLKRHGGHERWFGWTVGAGFELVYSRRGARFGRSRGE